jgi:anti-anti-sigma regulatory factor
MKTKDNLLEFAFYNIELNDNLIQIIEKTRFYIDIELIEINDNKESIVIVDFKNCQIISSFILHCLAIISKYNKVKLINTNQNINKLLEIMNMNKILEF